MRGFAIVAAALIMPALAVAQDQGGKQADGKRRENCFYSVGNQAIEVPLGANICRRQPAPYDDKYSLLRCNPPLDEIDSDLKRGDARCDRYEERQ